MRKLLVVLSFSGLFLQACQYCASAEDLQNIEVTVAVLTAMSGPSATNGEQCREGVSLARKIYAPADKIANYEINFVYGDHKTEPKSGISEFKKVVGIDSAIAVLTTRSHIAMPLNPLSKQMHIPLLATAGHKDLVAQNPYAFRWWPTAPLEGKALAKEILAQNKTKAAFITLEDEWTLSFAESVKDSLAGSGLEVVFSETIDESFTDFNSLLTKLSQAGADAIVINLAIAQSGLLVRKIRESGLQQAIFSNFWITNPEVKEIAGLTALEGTTFVETDLNYPRFRKRFKEMHPDSTITALSFICYGSLTSFLRALEKNPQIRDAESLYQTLLDMNEVDLLDGPLKITGREAQFRILPKVIRGGEVVVLGS